MHVGAVLFDFANNIVARDRTIVSLESGWASIGGGAPRRITSVHDLPSDVIWYTNIGYNDFFKANLHKLANFRNQDWLRTQFYHLVSELGVDLDSVPEHEAVQAIAMVAQRVARVAEEKYGVTMQQPRLNYDVGRALQAPRSAIAEDFYKVIPPIAQHPNVSTVRNINYTGGNPTVTVRRNRLQHARELLSTPVPSDHGWELESPVSLRKRGDNWLESVNTPFLVKCTVSNVIPLVAEVLSWNSGSRNTREWVTDLEWRIIRQYADVTVHSVLICNRPAERLPAFDRLPDAHAAELSLTYGLIAEQIWTAFTNPQPYKGEETRYTAAAAWLRAADRMRMFEFAQRLHSRGLDVVSYGVGNIVVRHPASGGLSRTLAIAADSGLLPPASKVNEAGRAGR